MGVFCGNFRLFQELNTWLASESVKLGKLHQSGQDGVCSGLVQCFRSGINIGHGILGEYLTSESHPATLGTFQMARTGPRKTAWPAWPWPGEVFPSRFETPRPPDPTARPMPRPNGTSHATSQRHVPTGPVADRWVFPGGGGRCSGGTCGL